MRAGDVFKGSYLKADDLNGRRVRVTIEDVTMEEIGHDDKKERRAVAHFEGKDKGLVLNKTNWSILEEVCNSQDSDDWAGYTVTLYVAKVDYQGKRVPAVRVSDQPGDTIPPAGAAPVEAPAGAITDDDIPF
jgi:hypothetical protein